MIAGRSPCNCASSASFAPMCISPATENDAPDHLASFHQGVAFANLWKPQNAADDWLDRAGREQVKRDPHILVSGVAGTRDPDAPHDHEAGVDLDALRANIAQHRHNGVLCGGTKAFAKRAGNDVLKYNVDALLRGPPPHL